MTDPKKPEKDQDSPQNAQQKPGTEQPKGEITPLDRWMALHQRSCWLITAGTAAAAVAVIFWLVPQSASTYVAVVFAITTMLLYRWCAGAPGRAINRVWQDLHAPSADKEKDSRTLDFLNALEKDLPSMQKKELAYPLTVCRAVLLSRLHRKEEALELLRSFDRVWDESQRKTINDLIRIISGKDPGVSEKEGE